MNTPKRKLILLEKVFAAEVEGRLPYQTRGKLADQLVAEGYLDSMEMVLDGRFPVRICGYQLTHLGRLIYCTSELCSATPTDSGETK